MLRPSIVFPLVLSLGLLAAQHSPLAGPVEGFVFDPPTHGFRAVSGSLGAASLGPVLLGGFEFGAVAPGKTFGLAYAAGQCFLITGLDSLQPASASLSDSCMLPEGAAWSGDGTVWVLYSQSGNWFQTVTGLPAQAAVNAAASVAALGGSLTAVASDATGARIFVSVTGSSAGVYQVQSDQSLALLSPLAQPIALAVSDERQVLYALDAAVNQIYELNLTDLSSQSWGTAGLLNPVAVRPGRDRSQRAIVYVAGGGDQLLTTYDAASHAAIVTLPLGFTPAAIDPLASHSFVLRSRQADGDPLWSFTDTPAPAAYFIPATPLSVAGGLQ
jgi:hypothetical protein